MGADSFDFIRVDIFDLHTAVVYIAGEKVGFIRSAKERWVESGPADDHESDTVDFVLHNRVCRDGGAEDDPFEAAEGLLVDQFHRDRQKRPKQVFFVGEDFGFIHDPEVIDENRIGMSTPHIYAQDHDRTSFTYGIYIMIKLT
jgi:hypothetical protein